MSGPSRSAPPSSDSDIALRVPKAVASPTVNLANIQAVFDAAKIAKVPVEFTDLEYDISGGAIHISRRGQVIRGRNAWYSIIKQLDAAQHCFVIEDDTEAGGDNTTANEILLFENLRIQGVGAGTATGNGIHAPYDGDVLVTRQVVVNGFANGIYADGWAQCHFEDSIFEWCASWGVYTPKIDSAANTIRFENSGTGHNGLGGWFHEGGGGCTVDGGDWVQQPLAMKLGTGVGSPSQVTLTGGNFEAVIGGTEFISCLSGTRLVVIGSQFQPQVTGGSAADAIRNSGATVLVVNPIATQAALGAGKAIVNNVGATDLSRVLLGANSYAAGAAVAAVRTPNGTLQWAEWLTQPDNAVPTAASSLRGAPLYVEGRDGVSVRDRLSVFIRDRLSGADAYYEHELTGRLRPVSATWDPPSIADGAVASTTITVTGARLGDFAVASLDNSIAGCLISAAVTATDTVTVTLLNKSGAPVDIASSTVRVTVIRR